MISDNEVINEKSMNCVEKTMKNDDVEDVIEEQHSEQIHDKESLFQHNSEGTVLVNMSVDESKRLVDVEGKVPGDVDVEGKVPGDVDVESKAEQDVSEDVNVESKAEQGVSEDVDVESKAEQSVSGDVDVESKVVDDVVEHVITEDTTTNVINLEHQSSDEYSDDDPLLDNFNNDTETTTDQEQQEESHLEQETLSERLETLLINFDANVLFPLRIRYNRIMKNRQLRDECEFIVWLIISLVVCGVIRHWIMSK